MAKSSTGVADSGLLPGLLSPPSLPTSNSPVGAEGHRHRMRQRLLTSGPDSLADHEMLEMMLFAALPRRDTKPIARALLKRFRDFAGVVGAPNQELREIDGLGDAGVAAIKLVQAAALRVMRHDVGTKSVLDSWDRLMAYLQAGMEHERSEQFRVLFLDKRNRLLADEILGRGTVDHAPAYPREIVRKCIQHNATAVILAHNHPSGDPAPSREDVAATEAVIAAVATIGVTVHDHVIVGRSRWLSFRQERLLQ
jgi:DNA repair protein RadC